MSDTTDTPWTPGPWRPVDHPKRDDTIQIWGTLENDKGEDMGHWLANTRLEYAPVRMEANARLIAKAPEMAELLEEVVRGPWLKASLGGDRELFEEIVDLITEIREGGNDDG